MSVVDRNHERDPFHPEWVGVSVGDTVETEHVMYVELQVERFNHTITLSKPAPEVWNKHPERAVTVKINGITFTRNDKIPPTCHSKGVIVFQDLDAFRPMCIALARETVESAIVYGWKAQVHASDYARWVGGYAHFK